MAAIRRIERATIDGWKTFDIGENFGTYLIAVKGSLTNDDIMSIDELRSVVLEIGIDSGIPNKPIAIQRVNLQFNNCENKSLALGMTSKLPKDSTYIRVVAFSDGIQEKLQGSMPVSINTVTII